MFLLNCKAIANTGTAIKVTTNVEQRKWKYIKKVFLHAIPNKVRPNSRLI